MGGVRAASERPFDSHADSHGGTSGCDGVAPVDPDKRSSATFGDRHASDPRDRADPAGVEGHSIDGMVARDGGDREQVDGGRSRGQKDGEGIVHARIAIDDDRSRTARRNGHGSSLVFPADLSIDWLPDTVVMPTTSDRRAARRIASLSS